MTIKALLPNRKELEYAFYLAIVMVAAFFWLEWSIEHQDTMLTMAETCAEYSGINEDNSEHRMELYYSCLQGE